MILGSVARWGSLALVCATVLTLVAARPSTERKNLVIIVVDTLRADHVGAMAGSTTAPLPPGTPRTTPNLDRWARDAYVFRRAWSQGAYTLASFLSYMTSTHVRTHGLDGNLGPAGICDWDDLQTLPEVLTEAGFQAEAWVANAHLHPKKGFPRGFQRWNGQEVSDDPLRAARGTDDDAVVSAAQAAFAAWDDADRHFLYLHLMTPHLPLRPSEAARERFDVPHDMRNVSGRTITRLNRTRDEDGRDANRRAYQATVWDADQHVAAILDELAATGHADDTIVAVFADHGEELWEQGRYGHMAGVWETLVHVPLIVFVPGAPGGVVDRPVGLIDVAPTVTRLLGVEPSEAWQGLDLIRPAAERATIAAQRFHERAITEGSGRKAIWQVALDEGAEANASRHRSRAASKAEDGAWSVFDLRDDPGESAPLDDAAALLRLQAAAADWEAETPEIVRPQDGEPHGICGVLSGREAEQHQRELEALGYVE